MFLIQNQATRRNEANDNAILDLGIGGSRQNLSEEEAIRSSETPLKGPGGGCPDEVGIMFKDLPHLNEHTDYV